MDPYVEASLYWEDFHDRLIFHLGSLLQEQLPDRYVATFQRRVDLVLETRQVLPDVSVSHFESEPIGSASNVAVQAPPVADPATLVKVQEQETFERFVEVLYIPDETVVAVLELASPTNKKDPRGRAAYGEKQNRILGSGVHLIEIDLLRAGKHWAAVPLAEPENLPAFDYLACVSRASRRDTFECYFRTVRQPLPSIAFPLLQSDPDTALDLQTAFTRAYEQAHLRSRIHYDRPLSPPLDPADRDWAQSLLREQGLVS